MDVDKENYPLESVTDYGKYMALKPSEQEKDQQYSKTRRIDRQAHSSC
jgi:hypothetical protein